MSRAEMGQPMNYLIPAGNEPSSLTCAEIWRLPRGSMPRRLQRWKFAAPLLAAGLST